MNDEVIELLKKTGAILADSHFVGTSGKHFETYINKDALYPHTKETSRMGELFAEKNKELDIDVVAAPALGGIILSTWTAYHLSKLKNKEILSVYTEKNKEKNQVFTRGYDALVKGKNVLVIEDLTQTGGSVKKVIASVRNAGGNVIAVSVMVNKDPHNITSETIDAPFSSLAELEVPSYSEEECPFCEKGIPIDTRVGHGKQYLAANRK
ncbi:MAG TPA: phosphoribosyltransferase family protein [Candidatus Saccharimonadales bacterium]|nr:phosphoribosyltransferase family protein [Candidatus Saccharimonadales bacterium]